jgi:hypothetical protein
MGSEPSFKRRAICSKWARGHFADFDSFSLSRGDRRLDSREVCTSRTEAAAEDQRRDKQETQQREVHATLNALKTELTKFYEAFGTATEAASKE